MFAVVEVLNADGKNMKKLLQALDGYELPLDLSVGLLPLRAALHHACLLAAAAQAD